MRMKELKFKVGQTVRVKYQPFCRVFIVEVTRQTCYANCEQNWYTGRLHQVGRYSKDVSQTLTRFSEIELEAIPVLSERASELITKIRAFKKGKEELIDCQDFEKAAEMRDKERRLRGELDDVIEDEGLSKTDVEI